MINKSFLAKNLDSMIALKKSQGCMQGQNKYKCSENFAFSKIRQ